MFSMVCCVAIVVPSEIDHDASTLTGDRSPEAEMDPRRGTHGTRPWLRKARMAWRTFHLTPEWPLESELTLTSMAPLTMGIGIAFMSLWEVANR